MLKKVLPLFAILLCNLLSAQEITGQIKDSNNNPVAFAAIQNRDASGVISNEEGFFTITLNKDDKHLTISCLGFKTKSISLSDLETLNYVITLEEQIHELNTVFVSSEIPDADKIIERVNTYLLKNYKNDSLMYRLFYRGSSFSDFNEVAFEIDKASGIKKKDLVDVNKSFDSLTRSIEESKPIHFKDFMADLMVWNRENSKIDVIKATKLIDQKKDLSIDDMQKRAQTIFLKYLDTTKTYKLKTGLLKIEDSLSLSGSKNNESKNHLTYEYDTEGLRNESHELLEKAQIQGETLLKSIINKDNYKYQYLEATFYNTELVHVIEFQPKKSKSLFTGKLYVSDETYAILRLDYAFGKGKKGEKLNLKFLLGIKYIEDFKSGTMIFEKQEGAAYHLKYIKEDNGSYFYVKRPIKFIENSAHKNKVSFTFLIEGNKRDKFEMLILNCVPLLKTTYDQFSETKKTSYQNLKSYDPTIWSQYNAIEPLSEMKRFKAED